MVAGGGSGGGDSDASQPVSGRGGRAAAQASEFRARHGPVMGPGAGVEGVGNDPVTGARRGPSPPPPPVTQRLVSSGGTHSRSETLTVSPRHLTPRQFSLSPSFPTPYA